MSPSRYFTLGMVFLALAVLVGLTLVEPAHSSGEAPAVLEQAQKHWRSVFHSAGGRGAWSAISWFMVIQALHVLALPLTMTLFRNLPDRGLGLSRLLGLFLVSYLAWVTVALGWSSYRLEVILAAMAVLGGISSLLLVFQWREIGRFLRGNWRVALAAVRLKYSGPCAVSACPWCWGHWRWRSCSCATTPSPGRTTARSSLG